MIQQLQLKKANVLYFRLFTQVCERMCHVYGRDDTTKIADHQQNVEQRHKNLATDFTKRRNEIQAMQNSFTSFDNSVERFFEWLFDVESTVEQLEGDVEASPKTKKVLRQKFEDIKVINDSIFNQTYTHTEVCSLKFF